MALSAQQHRKMRTFIYALRYRYEYEPAEVAFVLEHLKRGDCAVDIGSHCGAFTYWMQRAVGGSGRVFAFDPQPGCKPYMRAMIRDFDMTQVTFAPVALSSQRGTAWLKACGHSDEPNPEARLGATKGINAVAVKLATLGDFLARQNAPRVALIKCDVEGHELEVFRGAAERIRSDRPAILFECEERHLNGGTMNEVFQFLEMLGYRGVALFGEKRVPLSRFLAEQKQNSFREKYVNNFAFLPRERAAKLR
jgi:FkbM family methyltransferase